MALVRQLPSCAKANFGALVQENETREMRKRSVASLKVKSLSIAAGLQSMKSTKSSISQNSFALALK